MADSRPQDGPGRPQVRSLAAGVPVLDADSHRGWTLALGSRPVVLGEGGRQALGSADPADLGWYLAEIRRTWCHLEEFLA